MSASNSASVHNNSGLQGEKRQRGLRGQPIVMLGVLVFAWGAMRVATWASPVPEGYGEAVLLTSQPASDHPSAATDPRLHMRAPVVPVPGSEGRDGASPIAPTIAPALAPLDGGWNDPALGSIQSGIVSPEAEPEPLAADLAAGQSRARMRMAAGHTLLAAAGFSNMEVPPEIAAFYERALSSNDRPARQRDSLSALDVPEAAPLAFAAPSPRAGSAGQWSADGWLLWRDDTTTPLTSGRPSYGRSQIGAVVRYELAPHSRNRPQAYLRGSAALQGASEQEVSAGISARPLARVPIRFAAEVRVSDRAETSEVRPAFYAVTELAPQQLPGGLQAEAYAQAGYVGGDFATAFVDGQLRVDRSLAAAGGFDLRAGGAAWGGAQEDGERLDVGPSASASFRLGAARGRLAADYRFRVAGDAQPASGPALTLSAGF